MEMIQKNKAFIYERSVPQTASSFTNTSKNGFGYTVDGSYNATPTIFKQDFKHSGQLGEFLAILTLLRDCPVSIGIFNESQYATNVSRSLLLASVKSSGRPLHLAMIQLQLVTKVFLYPTCMFSF